jgi:hypothetical protein
MTVVWDHQHQAKASGVVEVEQTMLEEMAQQIGLVVVEGLEKHRPLLEHQLLVQVVEGALGVLLVALVERGEAELEEVGRFQPRQLQGQLILEAEEEALLLLLELVPQVVPA